MRIALLPMVIPAVCMAQDVPRVSLDSLQFSFGKVEAGTKVTHRFKVTNSGGGLLKILRLNPSCGCASAMAGKDTLGPGESSEIEIVFTSAGYRGLVSKTVEVVTNDPASPRQVLNFDAEVLAAVLVPGNEVFFEGLAPNARRKTSVKLESGTSSEILVADAELSEAPWLGVATRTVGKDLFVDLELHARKLPPDQASGVDTVTLHTLNPAPSTVVLKVRWEKQGVVGAFPPRVAWAAAAGRDLAAKIVLRHQGKKAFRILSASTTSPLLTVSELPDSVSREPSVRLVLSGKLQPGTYEEKVFLTLDLPGKPVVAVRVSAALR